MSTTVSASLDGFHATPTAQRADELVRAFFDAVKVNAEDKQVRENRLNLLASLRATLHQVADFSKIEG